jgi:hypothetical protein
LSFQTNGIRPDVRTSAVFYGFVSVDTGRLGVRLLLYPGFGLEPDHPERLRSFRLRFCASSCFLFFLIEGFS